MRSFLLLAAAFLLLFPGLAGAGRPANGYFYFTFSGSVAGDNLGKVEWDWDGRRHFTLGTPQTFPRVRSTHDLVYTWDNALLVTGKTRDELYRIKPGETAFETQKNPWESPEHIFVEPGLKSAWVTSRRSRLYRLPLDPYGQAIEVHPTGSENGINTIAYKDAEVAWYTQSTEGDSTRIGNLDTRTMATMRRLSVPIYVNDSHYDPFTGHVVMCGDKTVLQYDPEANAIVSQREYKQVLELYSCVVDGEGHVILSSWNGEFFFIDYSGTGMLGDPSNPGDTTMLLDGELKVMNGTFGVTPLIGPGSPPRIRRPFYVGTRGAYRDADGDGRIDGAVVEFKSAVYAAPGQVLLANPANPADPARSMVFDSTRITRLDDTRYLLDFRESPLPFGTSVQPGAAARILQDTALFGSDDLPMDDEVGPQVISAEALPPQKQGDKPVLTVTFSEAVGISLAAKQFPFLIKRPEAELDGKIRVESIRDLGNHRYEYVFASEDFPLLGDSLKLIPGDSAVRDFAGNPNNMSIWIEVGGKSVSVFTIQPKMRASVVSYQAAGPLPPAPAILVLHPAPEGDLCLNCAGNHVAASATQTPRKGLQEFDPFLMTVKIRGPVRYSLNFFTSMGTFVNRAVGEVTPEMIGKMRPGADRHYTIRLYWWPVTPDGRQAATGAYIMRGVLSGEDLAGPLMGPTSKSPGLPPKTEKISATFGYLRGH
jgi:hypothetical protein